MQRFLKLGLMCLCLARFSAAQAPMFISHSGSPDAGLPPSVSLGVPGDGQALVSPDRVSAPLVPPAVLPRMAPELALQVCRGRSVIQAEQLASYSATTVIHAELPDTAQYGEYEVQRRYSAPRTLVFKALRFTGDAFVKTNVITRLLQSEVDHVQKD